MVKLPDHIGRFGTGACCGVSASGFSVGSGLGSCLTTVCVLVLGFFDKII